MAGHPIICGYLLLALHQPELILLKNLLRMLCNVWFSVHDWQTVLYLRCFTSHAAQPLFQVRNVEHWLAEQSPTTAWVYR